MSKRNIAILGLLIVFMLSVLGVQIASVAGLAAVEDGGQAATFDLNSFIVADDDDVICPPAVPSPCSGG